MPVSDIASPTNRRSPVPAGENLLPVATAVEKATGVRPHNSTVIRWTKHGSQGVFLESTMVGGRRMTSIEAVYRFNERRTEVADGPAAIAPTAKQVSRAQAEAEALLEREGI